VDLGDSPPTAGETQRPYLRDVSRGLDEEATGEAASPDAERSEELRRKVKETRERLRGRKDGDTGQER
jgi:hypothetical protein